MEQSRGQTSIYDSGFEVEGELIPDLDPRGKRSSWRQKQRSWMMRQSSLDSSKMSGQQNSARHMNEMNIEMNNRKQMENYMDRMSQDVNVFGSPLFQYNSSTSALGHGVMRRDERDISPPNCGHLTRRFSVQEVQMTSASGLTFNVYQPVSVYTNSMIPEPKKALGRRHSSYVGSVTSLPAWYVIVCNTPFIALLINILVLQQYV